MELKTGAPSQKNSTKKIPSPTKYTGVPSNADNIGIAT